MRRSDAREPPRRGRVGWLVAAFALAWATSSSASAQDRVRADAAVDDGFPRASLEFVASVATAPRGGSFDLGVRFELAEGWHVYFRNPGEAALGTELTFAGEGATIGPVAWPTPTRLLDPSGTIATFGYEHEVLFPVRVAVAADAPSTLRTSVVADFLVCRVECIPGRVTLARTIPVADAPIPASAEVVSRFESTRAALPTTATPTEVRLVTPLAPLPPASRIRATLALTCPTCDPWSLAGVAPESTFFPDRIDGLHVRPIGLRATGATTAELELELESTADDPGVDQSLTGIVAIPGSRTFAREIALDVPRARAGAGVPTTAPTVPGAAPRAPPLGLLLLLGFLGGVVLNAMPCVLPVLALKLFALTRDAGADRRSRIRHVAAYSAGILASFLGLAELVLALRAAGTSVGWGMQLQEPRFVALLAAGVVAFAMGLFGVYSMGVDATSLAGSVDRRTGAARSFGEGVLAVVLATPCSAPFLGTAVGVALTQGGPLVVAVFVAVGLGLAAPYAALVLVPGASRLLPKPGAWMHVVEQALGFALLATAAWLVFLVGELTDLEGMGRALVGTWVAAAVVWAASLARSLPPLRRHLVRFGLVTLLGVASVALLRDLRIATHAPATTGSASWSDEAVREHLDAGAIVFVDFTAAWCITCKANERLVLDTDPVRRRFAEAGVVTLVGDYTRRDPRIAAVLERHRRAGVPLYLVHSPARPDAPEVLPELLTEGIVLDAIERAEGDSR